MSAYGYCILCDMHYRRGWYAAHVRTGYHRKMLEDRRKMTAWYRVNAA